MDLSTIPSNVFCSFTTSLPEEFHVDSSPIDLSTGSTHEHLNQLLQHLLQKPDIKFEFLINQEFLRGNLKSHICKQELNTEKTIEIHYSLQINSPTKDKEFPEDDWVSGLSSSGDFFVSSLFSGVLSLYSSMRKIASLKVSEKALKAVKLNDFQVIAGGLDCSVRVLEVHKKGFEPKYCLDGALDSIETLDCNPLDPRFVCAGTFDHSLIIWKIPSIEQSNGEQNPKKKIKADYKPVDALTINVLHSDIVSCVNWAETELICSGSYDHTVKLFDVNKKQEKQSISLRDSICSSMDKRNNILITGQENGIIKIWNLQDKDRRAQKTFKSHTSWVSDIKFHPQNEFLFASCSYDETIKIWDTRCTFPLFTLKGSLKQFALNWNSVNSLLSGGQDKKLSIHTFSQ